MSISGKEADAERGLAAGPGSRNPGPRIVVHAERRLCRTCLAALLGRVYADFDVVEADSVEAAVKIAADEPDVGLVLLSSICPGRVPLSHIAAAVSALPGTPVLLHTDTDDRGFVAEAMGLGLKGVLPVTLSGEAAVEAVRLVLAGGTFLPPMAPEGEARAPARAAPGQDARLQDLTARERTVLDLVGASLSNREIARMLGIAEGTVKIHVRNIMKKTGVHNRVQLALLAAGARGTNRRSAPRTRTR